MACAVYVCPSYIIPVETNIEFASGHRYASKSQSLLLYNTSEESTQDAHFQVLGRKTHQDQKNGPDQVTSWLVYKCVDIILNHNIQHAAVIATGVITNVLVIISILSAFPWVRKLVSRPFWKTCWSLTP